MCRKIVFLFLMSLVVLVVGNSTYGTNLAWTAVAGTSNWGTALNWSAGGVAVPTLADDVVIRRDNVLGANPDTSSYRYGLFPVISGNAAALMVRINNNNPAGAGGTAIPSLTVNDGGWLNIATSLYVSYNSAYTNGSADLYLNDGGEITVGASNAAAVTCVGGTTASAFGRLHMNGGLLDAKNLQIPDLTGSLTGAPGTAPGGAIYMAGGEIVALSLSFREGTVGTIDFTKRYADGGGKITVMDMNDVKKQALVDSLAGWLNNPNRIFTSAADSIVKVDYAKEGDLWNATIYAVPEPMTIALLGVGGLLLRRRSK